MSAHYSLFLRFRDIYDNRLLIGKMSTYTNTYKNVKVAMSANGHVIFANKYNVKFPLELFDSILKSDDYPKLINLSKWPVGYNYSSELFINRLTSLPLKAQKIAYDRLYKIKVKNHKLREHLISLAKLYDVNKDLASFRRIYKDWKLNVFTEDPQVAELVNAIQHFANTGQIASGLALQNEYDEEVHKMINESEMKK